MRALVLSLLNNSPFYYNYIKTLTLFLLTNFPFLSLLLLFISLSIIFLLLKL